MTICQCSKHGLRGIEHICGHIYAKIGDECPIKFYPITDEFFGILWLCSDCEKQYTDCVTDDSFDKFYSSLEVSCNSCFREWIENLSNLDDSVISFFQNEPTYRASQTD